MADQIGPNIENGAPKVEQTPVVKPTEPTKEAAPLGDQEQKIIERIDKDGDEDKVLSDIAAGGVSEATPRTEEDLEARKARIDGLWSAWEDVQQVPELVSLFDRKTEFTADKDPNALLQEHGYPPRTRISDLQFDTWTASLDPKFVKDGHVYLLRGDHPNLDKKGFYTRPFGYGKKTTEQLTHDLQSSDEVGYLLYGNDAYLKTAKPSTENIAQELAFKQSQIGGSSFISTTTNLEAAIAGTGNQPDPEEQSKYEVYVVKVPLDAAINSNTNNYFGMEENEYLVPDYITPDEVVAKFPRDQREAVYQYMHDQLGITREDLGMKVESDSSTPVGEPEKPLTPEEQEFALLRTN